MKRNKSYNGWSNRATRNIALWIMNDEGLYNCARDFMKTYHGKSPYRMFLKRYGMKNDRTPDRFKFSSENINYKEMNTLFNEIFGHNS